MGFRYETHMHTAEVSACASAKAVDYIRFYQERGYSGIIITDHFFRGNCGIDRSLPWKEWVAAFCRGYELAWEAGDKAGLSVFFAWEDNFSGDEYLVYGLDKQWLLDNEGMRKDTREQYYRRIHEAGGIVVQAHPFRERGYLDAVRLNPHFVDGVEQLNLGNEPYQDALAKDYARKYQLPVTAGTDMHHITGNPPTAGIESEKKLNSIQDFVELIRSGKGYRLIEPGERSGRTKKITELPVYLYQKQKDSSEPFWEMEEQPYRC